VRHRAQDLDAPSTSRYVEHVALEDERIGFEDATA